MPVAQRRLAARSQRDQVDAELREAAGLAQPCACCDRPSASDRLGIARAAHFGDGGGIERRQTQRCGSSVVSSGAMPYDTRKIAPFSRPARHRAAVGRPRRGNSARVAQPIMNVRTRAETGALPPGGRHGRRERRARAKLIDDFSAVLGEAEDMLKRCRDRNGREGPRSPVAGRGEAPDRQAPPAGARRPGLDQAKAAARATDDYVHDNPWQAIGVAAAVGFLAPAGRRPSLMSGPA